MTPVVAAPGDTHPSDATVIGLQLIQHYHLQCLSNGKYAFGTLRLKEPETISACLLIARSTMTSHFSISSTSFTFLLASAIEESTANATIYLQQSCAVSEPQRGLSMHIFINENSAFYFNINPRTFSTCPTSFVHYSL